MKRANEICQLEEPVIRGMHALREFNAFTKLFLKGLMEKVCDRRLPAILIDLGSLDIKKIHTML